MTQHLWLLVALSATLATLVIITEGRTVVEEMEVPVEAEPEVDDLDGDYMMTRRRRADDYTTPWLGPGKRQARFTPYVSVGVLSNMQQFFDNLRTNLDSLESLPSEERDALLGNTPPSEKDQFNRPAATAAYLHAMRNQRPSYKIRNFVESPEPAYLRGTNHYDPSLLWTGLGRRKR